MIIALMTITVFDINEPLMIIKVSVAAIPVLWDRLVAEVLPGPRGLSVRPDLPDPRGLAVLSPTRAMWMTTASNLKNMQRR